MSAYSHGHLSAEEACRLVSSIIRGQNNYYLSKKKPPRRWFFEHHCRQIAKAFPNTKGDSPHCLAAERLFVSFVAKTRVMEHVEHRAWNAVAFLMRLCRFRDRWVRSPEDWEPPDCEETFEVPESWFAFRLQWSPLYFTQMRSLVRHLLGRYPLPEFWDLAWFQPAEFDHRQLDWYVHVAQGQNLRTVKDLPTKLSKRAVHLMQEAPRGLTFLEVIRWAQLRAIGSTRELIQQLLETPAATDFEHDDVWLPLVRLLGRDPDFEPQMTPFYIDYVHRRRVLDPLGARYSLKGKTRQSLLREMIEFDGYEPMPEPIEPERPFLTEQPNRNRRVFGWAKQLDISSLDEHEKNEHGTRIRWMLFELCKPYQLVVEGRRLGHCVATYIKKCQNGDSSIWSLRSERNNTYYFEATIEVNPYSHRILQVSAHCNSRPPEEAMQMIYRWATQNRLRLGKQFS
ncbi:MAG: PcfJ domain-containing protein [Verrucomicrobiota bacterium]